MDCLSNGSCMQAIHQLEHSSVHLSACPGPQAAHQVQGSGFTELAGAGESREGPRSWHEAPHAALPQLALKALRSSFSGAGISLARAHSCP